MYEIIYDGFLAALAMKTKSITFEANNISHYCTKRCNVDPTKCHRIIKKSSENVGNFMAFEWKNHKKINQFYLLSRVLFFEIWRSKNSLIRWNIWLTLVLCKCQCDINPCFTNKKSLQNWQNLLKQMNAKPSLQNTNRNRVNFQTLSTVNVGNCWKNSGWKESVDSAKFWNYEIMEEFWMTKKS